MPPVFSVVIPCFNYARYLPDCLDSIFQQVDAPEFEVIAVNDGSTDETAEILDGIRDPRLIVVHNERNLGHVATINRALPLTRGAIVSRIDPDDRYHPQFMATVCDRLRRFPEVGLVYGRAAIIDDSGRSTGDITPSPHASDFTGSDLLQLLEQNFICAPTVAARREAWVDAVPVPDGLAFHDWYFTVLIARRYPFHFIDQVLADYRVHGSNHHSKISKDGSEERSVLRVLDSVFSTPEADPSLEMAKRRARSRIYAAHYLDFANKYFWFGRTGDARRCYLEAIRRRPSHLLDSGVARRVAATVTSRRLYEGVKAVWKTGVATR
jgi:glycosyltransferase involved in cell wall biosynthesis